MEEKDDGNWVLMVDEELCELSNMELVSLALGFMMKVDMKLLLCNSKR